MRAPASLLRLLAFAALLSWLLLVSRPALAEDLALPVGYVANVSCSPDEEVDGPCAFELEPGGELFVSLDVLGPASARVTGTAPGAALLRVSADRLLGPGELLLVEEFSIEVYPFATSLGVSFGQPVPPE